MSGDLAPVEALYFKLLDAWNRRDAADMASLYADDGIQIGFDGSRADGRQQVRAHLEPIFRDHPTARYVAKLRDCRLLSSKTALLTAVSGMVPPGSEAINSQTNALQTLVASRTGDKWRAVLFQNTPAAYHGRDEDRARLTAELQGVADKQSD